MCHVSRVTIHLSRVTCHKLDKQNKNKKKCNFFFYMRHVTRDMSHVTRDM